MNQDYFGLPKPEKELHALMGIMKLRNVGKFDEQNVKFKKSAFQTKVLECVYEITCFPSSSTRKDLAILLSMPEKSVQVWFQNSRQANKRLKNHVSMQNTEIFEVTVPQILEIIKNVKISLNYQ
ncbi:uncharacterized protein VICG_01256 [Vittaforma corneae ATCC 50505]|uniref:Homeobox domain-containing protein n=1 Tax=Vittaforma corneae (strain ATCC 50505) TaxID=993615 RepID=L2GN68_VITCO|nr:uncharacterized protein VICG_01256 [Vittaforma corneae ATCC 50505]ELA41752.1 hypothetical protein VICG_01256 [Vittaforma corneae ATCC 50505]